MMKLKPTSFIKLILIITYTKPHLTDAFILSKISCSCRESLPLSSSLIVAAKVVVVVVVVVVIVVVVVVVVVVIREVEARPFKLWNIKLIRLSL